MNTLFHIVSIITIVVAVIDLMIGCYICTRTNKNNFDAVLTIFIIFAGIIAMFMGIAGLTLTI